MRLHCISIAVCMLAASGAAGETRPPPPEEGTVFWCVVEGLQVDGLPVLHHAWCVRLEGRIVPLVSELGQHQIFGIRPANGPRPPIPKDYKPLE